MDLSPTFTVHSIVAFLEFLYVNQLSLKVIQNYLSSLKKLLELMGGTCHPCHINWLQPLSEASQLIHSSPLSRRVFLILTFWIWWSRLVTFWMTPTFTKLLFYWHFSASFSWQTLHHTVGPSLIVHILRQDIIFAPPGAHVLLKWTKTLQESRSHHFVQIPSLGSHSIMPSFSP